MGAAGGIFVMLISLAVSIGIMALIAWLLSGHLQAIPASHRKLQPNQVWLLLIPLFNLYWNFKVFLGISDSYKSYFDSVGRTDVGDCARQMGLFFSIAACCAIIPCVNMLAGPAALVLLIIYFVKIGDLKTKLGGQPA